jgi:UDP-glucose 4-epimerase
VAAGQKIREELGWTPKQPELEAMIADAWAFAQEHPQGYSGS